MKNSTVFKLLGIAGTVLGTVSTVLSNVASSKEMKQTVADEVKKALQK